LPALPKLPKIAEIQGIEKSAVMQSARWIVLSVFINGEPWLFHFGIFGNFGDFGNLLS